MTQTPPTTPPDDDIDEDEDDTVQGVSRRAEKLRAEADRLQREQNDAAGLTTPDPNAPPPPAETPADPKAPRKPTSP